MIEKVCSEKASFILWENSPQPSFNLNHQGTLKFQRYRQLIGTDLNFGVFPLKFAQRRPQSPKWVARVPGWQESGGGYGVSKFACLGGYSLQKCRREGLLLCSPFAVTAALKGRAHEADALFCATVTLKWRYTRQLSTMFSG